MSTSFVRRGKTKVGAGRLATQPDSPADVQPAIGPQTATEVPAGATPPLVLQRAHLALELKQDGGLRYLLARSTVDPMQSLLLPLSDDVVCTGLSLFTRLGRMHSLCWGLAYGVGSLPDDVVVEFASGTLRYRQSAEVTPLRLGDDVWVADAEGVFSSVTMFCGDVELHRAALADRW